MSMGTRLGNELGYEAREINCIHIASTIQL